MAKVIRWWQLVPTIFDADVLGEPTDRFQPFVALRCGWPLDGPIDRGLRVDVRFVPLGGKTGQGLRMKFCVGLARGSSAIQPGA